MWVADYAKSCGKLDMTYALQNASLNGCAYLTFPVSIYISTLYRSSILGKLVANPAAIRIQDTSSKSHGCVLVIRLVVAALMCCPLAIPALTITVEHVGSPIVIMLTNIAIPTAIGGIVLGGGLYELVVQFLEKRIGFGKN